MSIQNFHGFPREFNSESEQLAADRRARVAAAVSQQEWLDKEEIKWIPQKYRTNAKHGDGEFLDDEESRQGAVEQSDEPLDEGNIDYLLGPEPEDDPAEDKKKMMKQYAHQWAVVIFALIFLGGIYFFWDTMHTHLDPHQPLEMTQVEGEGMPAPADDGGFGTGDPSMDTPVGLVPVPGIGK